MKWLVTVTVAAILVAMAWLGSVRDDWLQGYSFTGQKNDYYNLLVDGFLDGHLYMKATPSPELFSPDPAVRHSAPYLLDASLYNHHYYLYYGVAPAILAFLPYSALTGQDLGPNVVTFLFVAMGFLFAALTYDAARRRYFSDLHPALVIFHLGLLAFATVTPVLVRSSGHYEVPIACAYGLAAAATWMLYRALHAQNRGIGWVAGASLMFGLAVGGRPNFIFSVPLVAVAAGWIWWHRRQTPAGPSHRTGTVRLVLAAVVPAAVIGLLLATYNYLRFNDPFEFGFDYGINAFFATGKPVASTAFIWPNLKWYYLTPPALSPYFPYCFSINANRLPPSYYGSEAIHGQWPVFVLALVVLAGWLLSRRRRDALPGPLRFFAGMLLWMFVTGLLFMTVLGIRADRYMPDFQAPLILLLVLLAGYYGRPPWRTRLRRLWTTVFVCAATAAILFNFLIAIEIFNSFAYTRRRTFATLARYGDIPIDLLAKWGLVSYGPVRFKVVFHRSAHRLTGPLLAAGTPNKTDVLYANQKPDGTVRLSLLHDGYGAIQSAPLPLEFGHAYTVKVEMGALYPPAHPPFFPGWRPEDVRTLKTTARVWFDGREVLNARMGFYDAPPNWIFFGRDPAGTAPPFTGRISAIRRLPMPTPASLAAAAEPGMWRLAVTPDFSHRRIGEPIIASGVSGHGNLLFLEVMEPGAVRFGLDQWGYGAVHSPTIKLAPHTPHQLEVFIGPQVVRRMPKAERAAGGAALKKSAGLMRVWLDGRPIWTTPILINKQSYDFVTVGHNLQGFSSATTYFQGTLRQEPFPLSQRKKFLELNLQDIRSTPPP